MYASVCPLASPDEVSVNTMIDAHGITTYPRAPDSTESEDILLANLFYMALLNIVFLFRLYFGH